MASWKTSLRAVAILSCVWPRLALAQGDGTFESPLRVSLPNAVGVDAGDFNADGKLDLAVVDGSNRLTIILQGDRARQDWGTKSATGGGFHLRAGDFDGDGDDDVVTANPGSASYFVRSKGDGTFQSPLLLARSQGARWVATGDFDADGNLDVATANQNASSVSVYRGGGGNLTHLQNFNTGDRPHSIVAADYDGDQKLDLLAAMPGGIAPMRGTGDGKFTLRPILSTFGGCYHSLFSADFNGDGFPDLVSPCGVDINTGRGGFRRVLQLGLFIAAVGDLDGDGAQDLVAPGFAVGRNEGAIVVYRGKGDGTFHPPADFAATGLAPSFLLARDLDGDGRTDLIAADAQSSALTVIWGKPEPGFLSLGISLGGWSSVRTAAVGDLDRDGRPDVFAPLSTDSKVLVYLHPGFVHREGPALTLDTRSIYNTIKVADLDGDGTPDLAGTNRGGGLGLAALIDPAGKVRAEVQLAAGLNPSAVAVEQLDAGGIPDLAVACTASNHVAVFLGLGAGEFSAARIVATIERPRDLAGGDLDGDGRKDLAVISTTALAVHFGKGDGDFEAPVVREVGSTFVYSSVVVAPIVGGDGLDDVLITESRGHVVQIWQAKAGRELEGLVPLRVAAAPVSLEVADLNGDGLLDVTTAGSTSQSVTVLLQRPEGGWSTPGVYWPSLPPLGHRLADFNGDGAMDALVFSANSNVILSGRKAATAPFLRGDADADGKLAVNDPIAILSRLFLGGELLQCEDAADADDDGGLNVADPISLLRHLFLGAGALPPPGPERCGADPTEDRLPACAAGCP